MPPAKLLVNGIDLSTFGMWIESPRGWADAPRRRDRTLDVQGAGEMIVTHGSTLDARRWSLRGAMLAETVQDAQDKWDAVKLHIHNAWIEVMVLPWTDRVCVCRYEDFTWDEGRIESTGFRFTLTLRSPSSYLVSPTLDTYGLTTAGEVPLILGTAPSPFIVEFIGPATRPTLSYYDVNGQVRGSVALAANLAAGEWLHFNSQTYLMQRHTPAGAVVDGASYLDNASRAFAFDPLDGVPERGPVLVLDSGTALVYTRRCFL